MDLCKKCIRPTLKDFGDSIIYCHIFEATQMFRDTVINTVKFGYERLNMYQSPFIPLMTFGNYPKSTNVGIRAGVLVTGPAIQ